MALTFVIMAGGTGGHVFPGLAVARQLAAQGHTVEWLGTSAGIEARLVPGAGYALHCLPVSGVRGKGIVTLLLAPFMILRSMLAAFKLLRMLKPVVVLGFGGFAAGPGAIACKLLGKPLLIHEQNSVIGTTNKLLQYLANRCLEGFPNTFSYRKSVFYTGNPVSEGFSNDDFTSESSLEPLDNNECRVLVVGGSRGARALNENLPKLLHACQPRVNKKIVVRHQSGVADETLVHDRYEALDLNASVEAFIEDMPAAYRWATIVVCRSGAMTVAELAAAGVASVLVPFPFAIDDHQTVNARWLQEQGAAELVPQSELTNESTQELLIALFNDTESIQRLSQAAKKIAVMDAAQEVARHCLQAAGLSGLGISADKKEVLP